ncbi:LytTR family transcriptional regulator DNA-binding domain-containing protein [Marinococcus sp. PL1-022]|uniref:LytTR family transcriptional regulator DNA-binding domain-containing protein n=1 Tax=Marinococcus sp. PL1-022 TaxID=3095363 RepID=UPI0029C2AD5B|nr:LytTR family transcriptional regulator DNA-binding domain-containing protein [Marinococcus sp. PL1-022]MDX6152615.1 LytTR family transcriptional regulator DNA-binding domain-containing protein [Marinococcus sp. PL1-022]
MPLLTLENVMKQENDRTVLKNLTLTIEEKSQIGIKMTHHESLVFFKLLSGELAPSSGDVKIETSAIVTELTEDALYEGLTVSSYLNIFKKLADFQEPLETFIGVFSLSDVWHTRISRLSLDQKKRISLFRMFLFSPRLLLIQSPLSNATDEGIELYLQALDHLRSKNTAVVCTSTFLEELLLLSNDVYRYNRYTGLEKTDLADSGISTQSETNDPDPKPNKVYKVSSRMADKTIFFSPNEIDFIESVNSVSTIRIGEEHFPTDLTMNELEAKLTNFGFFRCHRSYLVNLQRVSELVSYSKNSYTLVLKGNTNLKLPLSRNRLEEMKALMEF